MSQIAKRKDPLIAGALSFLTGGGGQIYCGKTALGLIFVVVGVALWFTVVGGILFGLMSALHAKGLAEDFNEKIDNEKRKNEILAMEREEEMEIVNETQNQINSFVETAEKYYKLLQAEIYSPDEYAEKLKSLISTLATQKLLCSPEEFLFALVPLKEKNILSSDDIKKIKALIL